MVQRFWTTILSCLLMVGVCHAFPLSARTRRATFMSMSSPRGSAARPFDKQKVAVFGGGGYMGGITFGFLQRCASLYGSGLGGIASPRCIGAAAVASDSLNRILSKNFALAFAGEDMVRLTDMQDVKSIQQRLDGYSAAIVGTEYFLETRPVTANTYEKTPNDKTIEFYLDTPRRSDCGEGILDPQIHLSIFENTLEACRLAKTKHLIVIETPRTRNAKQYAQLLDKAGVPFTYLRVCAQLENFPDYSYIKGVQGDLSLESFTFAENYQDSAGHVAGSWIDDLDKNCGKDGVVYREDLAALAVQCLQTLDWNTSRCLLVSSGGALAEASAVNPKGRHDREWCVNSEILASKLSVVQ